MTWKARSDPSTSARLALGLRLAARRCSSQVRHGEHRRPGFKGEVITVEHPGPTAGSFSRSMT